MYILECADGSYYTGSTKHLEKRLAQHQAGEGANHTKKHLPVKLVYFEEFDRIDTAFNREKQVQGWSRKKKEALINGMPENLHDLAKCMNETAFDSAQATMNVTNIDGFDSAQPTVGVTDVTDTDFDFAQATMNVTNIDGFDSAQPTVGVTDVTDTDFDSAQSTGKITDAERSRSGSDNILKGWVETTLGEVVERITKGTTPKEFSTDKDDVNYIKSDALQYGGFLDSSRFVKITHDVNDKLKRSKLKVNDILLSMAGEKLGKTGLVTQEHLPANTNQAVAIVTVNNELVNHMYIWYKLRNRHTVKYFKSIPSQSAQPNINFQEIRSLPIYLPPLPEQKAIAKILTAFDDKIENLQAQNKTLETTAQIIFKEWFGQYQIGDELPDGWRVGKLGDFGKIITGKTPSKNNTQHWGIKIPFITPSDFKNFGLYSTYTQRYLSELGYFKLKTNQIPKNSIMVTCIGSDMGKVCINSNDSITNQQINSIIINNSIHLGFVYEFIKSQYQKLRTIALGGSTMPIINKTDFSNIEILIPKDELFIIYDNLWKPISLKIKNNSTQIQALKKTRDTLLPKLMSGSLRVNEFKNT